MLFKLRGSLVSHCFLLVVLQIETVYSVLCFIGRVLFYQGVNESLKTTASCCWRHKKEMLGHAQLFRLILPAGFSHVFLGVFLRVFVISVIRDGRNLSVTLGEPRSTIQSCSGVCQVDIKCQ